MSTDQQQTLVKLLVKERDAYLAKANSISQTIEILEQSMTRSILKADTPKIVNDDYNTDMSIKNKILFFFKQEQRFMHARKLAELANAREPSITVKKFSSRFSTILSTLKREGKLVKYVINKQNNNTFWGSPKWLDSHGQILSEYKYDEKYVKVTGNTDQFEL